MRKIAVMLTDDDIANAAAYLTQATPYPAGDVMTPYPELVKAGERLEYDPNTK
jgi:cytochrome c553